MEDDVVDFREMFPEADLVDAGDPFVTTIVGYDDAICDYRYNYDWLGLAAIDGEARAQHWEAEQLRYEGELLERWWVIR